MEDTKRGEYLLIKFKFKKDVPSRRFTFAAENDATHYCRLSPNDIDDKSSFECTLGHKRV